MTYLATLVRTGTQSACAAAFIARLRGTVFDEPYRADIGERPEDALIALWRLIKDDRKAARRYVRAVTQLARTELAPLFQHVVRNQATPTDHHLLASFARLIESSQIQELEHYVQTWLDRLIRSSAREPLACELVRCLLAAYTSLDSASAIERVPRMLRDARLRDDIAQTVASRYPLAFLRRVLEPYIDSLQQNFDDAAESLLYHVIRTALQELVAIEKAHDVSDTIERLKFLIRRFVSQIDDDGARHRFRRSVVTAMAVAEMPPRRISEVEQAFWDALPRVDFTTDESLRPWREKLSASLAPIRVQNFDRPTLLIIAQVPYAEAGYLTLLGTLCRMYFDIPVHYQLVQWNDVGDAILSSKEVMLGLNNRDIFSKDVLSRNRDIREVSDKLRRLDPYCYVFRHFTVLASVPFLQRCIQAGSSDLATAATRVLDGDELVLLDDTDRALMSALMKRAHVTTPWFTVVDEVARELSTVAGRWVNRDSDLGLWELLDGDVDMYLGGALHTDYALRMFPNFVRAVGRVERSTFGYLFARSDHVKTYPEFFWQIAALWRAAVGEWSDLAAGRDSGAGDSVGHEIVASLNRMEDVRAAFADSFDGLTKTLKSCAELMFPDELPKWVPCEDLVRDGVTKQSRTTRQEPPDARAVAHKEDRDDRER